MVKLVRAEALRAYEHLDSTVILDRRGAVLRFDGGSAELARAVLTILTVAHTRDEVMAALEGLTGEPMEHHATVDELLAVLTHAGAVIEARPSGASTRVGRRVVLGITGAVATAHTPALVMALQARGHDVRVAATKRATEFVTEKALLALTHHPVSLGMWGSDRAHPAAHIELSRWAEGVLIAPASATTLARIAHGSFTDVVSALALTSRAPVVLAPSMNHAMRESPAVARNLAQLREDGHYVLHPGLGLEVADAPGARVLLPGPMASHGDTVAMFEAILAERSPRASEQNWDEIYRTRSLSELPWEREGVDDDLRALTEPLVPCSVWEIGAGTGALAVYLADEGFSVLATDVSRTALGLAQRRDGASRVRWVVDDVLDSRVEGCFDLVLDRGCLHALAPSRHGDYVRVLGARTARGARVIVKAHSLDAAATLGTTGFTRASIEALFAPTFALESAALSTMPGPAGASAEAWCCVLRRA